MWSMGLSPMVSIEFQLLQPLVNLQAVIVIQLIILVEPTLLPYIAILPSIDQSNI